MTLEIAVLGASGIGKYHVREFLNLGHKVTCILGSTKDSVQKTAADLEKAYGIKVRPYFDIDELLRMERIDAASICTPAQTHYSLAKKCLEACVNVLCEKPFTTTLKEAKELFKIARKNKKVLTVNTQWPSVLNSISYDKRIRSFEMTMEPGVKGVLMLPDHLPHTNSMLVKLAGIGNIESIEFSSRTDEYIDLSFNYLVGDIVIPVRYIFKFKADRPRKVSFRINDKDFRREVGENYSQFLVSRDERITIEDPLKVSVRQFVEAIVTKKNPLNTPEEILANMQIQEEITKAYEKN